MDLASAIMARLERVMLIILIRIIAQARTSNSIEASMASEHFKIYLWATRRGPATWQLTYPTMRSGGCKPENGLIIPGLFRAIIGTCTSEPHARTEKTCDTTKLRATRQLQIKRRRYEGIFWCRTAAARRAFAMSR